MEDLHVVCAYGARLMGLGQWQAFLQAMLHHSKALSPAQACTKEIYHNKECDKRSWVELDQ